jgi:hypothetical protein
MINGSQKITPNQRLQRTRYGGLRPPARAAEPRRLELGIRAVPKGDPV